MNSHPEGLQSARFSFWPLACFIGCNRFGETLKRCGTGRAGGAVLAIAASIFLPGCSGNQSSLDPAGEQADRIEHLWWLFFGVMVCVYGLVLIFVVFVMLRRRSEDSSPILNPEPRRERGM